MRRRAPCSSRSSGSSPARRSNGWSARSSTTTPHSSSTLPRARRGIRVEATTRSILLAGSGAGQLEGLLALTAPLARSASLYELIVVSLLAGADATGLAEETGRLEAPARHCSKRAWPRAAAFTSDDRGADVVGSPRSRTSTSCSSTRARRPPARSMRSHRAARRRAVRRRAARGRRPGRRAAGRRGRRALRRSRRRLERARAGSPAGDRRGGTARVVRRRGRHRGRPSGCEQAARHRIAGRAAARRGGGPARAHHADRRGRVEAAAGARVVAGASPRWRSEGLGAARSAIAAAVDAPCLVVRRGLRPGGLSPPEA